MKLALRFIVPLLVVLGVLGGASVFMTQRMMSSWVVRDVETRSNLAANAIAMPLSEFIEARKLAEATPLLERLATDERLTAAAFCPADGSTKIATALYPNLPCDTVFNPEARERWQEDSARYHIGVVPVVLGGKQYGSLVFIHDLRYAQHRFARATRYIFFYFVTLALVVSAVAIAITHWSLRAWARSVRTVIRHKGNIPASAKLPDNVVPIVKDVRRLVRELEDDGRRNSGARIVWNPKTLREILRSRLAGDEIVIVSNREPYIHEHKADGIEVRVPPSGLVTALEPIMRACSGTWVAFGSGSADKEVVDVHDRVGVPPGEASYRLRRVWMSEQEENGFYYGFSNEGLWPLCHIAHTRPVFRSSDWETYKEINHRFLDAVCAEVRSDSPVILVQDYHFAVLPRLLRDRLPKATIITFWHIPWPNAEAFGICPWASEILVGLLGSTILGFHTQYHCNNFLETVDRLLECRIDREQLHVSYDGKLSAIRSYPISIEWPPHYVRKDETAEQCRKAIREAHNLSPDCLIGVGIDRLDYTKGIVERLSAVERFFEFYPEWQGKLTFIQVAAPSRTRLEPYRKFADEVRCLAASIAAKYSSAANPAVILLEQSHPPQEVYRYLRAATMCMVTSLHDGMNLVAKEYIASHDDERGVLILSKFTGASREFLEALIINPYNIEECAQAVYRAVTMPLDEQAKRMRSMREQVQEYNVYRWAGKMLIDAAEIRERTRLVANLDEGTRPAGNL